MRPAMTCSLEWQQQQSVRKFATCVLKASAFRLCYCECFRSPCLRHTIRMLRPAWTCEFFDSFSISFLLRVLSTFPVRTLSFQQNQSYRPQANEGVLGRVVLYRQSTWWGGEARVWDDTHQIVGSSIFSGGEDENNFVNHYRDTSL